VDDADRAGGPRSRPIRSRVLYGAHLALGLLLRRCSPPRASWRKGRSSARRAPISGPRPRVAPLAILVALYYRIYGFERSLPFAALALLIAALFAVATDLLTKREPRPGLPSAAAIFATGSIAALALALTSRWRRAGSPSRSP
jgi:uncharacterized membrane protein